MKIYLRYGGVQDTRFGGPPYRGDRINHIGHVDWPFYASGEKSPAFEDTDFSGNYIVESDIVINGLFAEGLGHDDQGRCCVRFNWEVSRKNELIVTRSGVKVINMQSVLAHELGHTLGLTHTFGSADAVMYYGLEVNRIKIEPHRTDEAQMRDRYCTTSGGGGGGGCRVARSRTIALIPTETAALFAQLLESPKGNYLQEEAQRLILEQRYLAASVNTFILSHLDFLLFQATLSPQALTEEIITSLRALLGQMSLYASPGLQGRLNTLASYIRDKSGWTLHQLADGFQSTVDGPAPMRLVGNYPNPFNARTIIEYELTEPQQVDLHVYNLAEAKVATLVSRAQPAGRHSAAFDASALASGVYIYLLSTPMGEVSKAMTIVK